MKKFPFIILFSLCTVACNYDTLPEIPKPIHYEKNPEAEPEPEAGGNIPIVFSGSFGDAVTTRAGISDGKITWNAGDRIQVLWNDGFNYATASTEGTSAEFSTEVNESDTYWAVYPSSLEASVGSEGLSIIVPDQQQGEFDKVNIAVATTPSGNNSLVFHNLCGLGSFTLDRNDIARIVFKGLSGESLAGNAVLAISDTGIPSVASLSSAVDSITVVPATESSFAAGTYYFAAVPGALEAGVRFTLTTSSGNTIIGKAFPAPDQLNRSEIRSFGTLDNISTADVLQLRFIFGPDAGAKAIYDPENKWPDVTVGADLADGVNYTYVIDGKDYSFYVKDLTETGSFSWNTNNKDGYADRICIPSATVYFGLPAIEGLKLTGVVVGQSRRGSKDNAEDKITTVGITDCIPEGAKAEKSYVSGGELQEWPGWAGKKDKKVVDHEFHLSGTQANTTYYLNSDNSAIGLYFSRLVLTYEK